MLCLFTTQAEVKCLLILPQGFKRVITLLIITRVINYTLKHIHLPAVVGLDWSLRFDED